MNKAPTQRQSNASTAQSFLAQAEALATLNANTSNMQRDLQEMRNDIKELKGEYVTRAEFVLVRNLVFAMFGTVLLYVLNQLLSLISIHH